MTFVRGASEVVAEEWGDGEGKILIKDVRWSELTTKASN